MDGVSRLVTTPTKLVYDTLDPDLKCYVEYSNETWNFHFGNEGMFAEGRTTGQYTWCIEQGKRLGFGTNDIEAGALYHVYASSRLWKAFQDVYGGEMSRRVVKVLAGFVADPWRAKVHLRALSDRNVNIYGIQPDTYTLAPYFGHDVDGDSPMALAELRTAMHKAADDSRAIKKILAGTGIDLIAYEGGQHVIKNPVAINRNQHMYTIYCEYLAEMSSIYSTFLAYCNCSSAPPTFGYFGAKEHTGQDISETPKYRALYHWIHKRNTAE